MPGSYDADFVTVTVYVRLTYPDLLTIATTVFVPVFQVAASPLVCELPFTSRVTDALSAAVAVTTLVASVVVAV